MECGFYYNSFLLVCFLGVMQIWKMARRDLIPITSSFFIVRLLGWNGMEMGICICMLGYGMEWDGGEVFRCKEGALLCYMAVC